MSPNYQAFVDELALIKTAAEKKHKSEVPGLLKNRFLKSAPKFALGAFGGAIAGTALGEAVRPTLLKNMSRGGRNAALATAGGLGAITAVAMWDAMRTADKADKAGK